jgi:hypothetical protein
MGWTRAKSPPLRVGLWWWEVKGLARLPQVETLTESAEEHRRVQRALGPLWGQRQQPVRCSINGVCRPFAPFIPTAHKLLPLPAIAQSWAWELPVAGEPP